MENKKLLDVIITRANAMIPKYERWQSKYECWQSFVTRQQSDELARNIVKKIEVQLRRKINEAIMSDVQKSEMIEISVPWAVDIEFPMPFEPEDSMEVEPLTEADYQALEAAKLNDYLLSRAKNARRAKENIDSKIA